MNMDLDIRVRVDRKLSKLYNDLKGKVIEDFHELFFFFACIGFCNKCKQPLGKKEDKFWSKTIKPCEWACYYSMILETHDFDIDSISDTDEVIREIEEYANGGFNIAYKDFLSDFITKANGEYRLSTSLDDAELMFDFINFIYEKVSL